MAAERTARRGRPVAAHELESLLASAVTAREGDVDELALRASINLKRAAVVLNQREVSALHQVSGSSSASMRVLIMVWAFGPMEAKDLARLSGVTRQAVSGCLATLERDGLVRRERELSEDRRLVSITVTPSGREAVEGYLGPQNALHRVYFRSLEDSELETLVQLLSRLVVTGHDHVAGRPQSAHTLAKHNKES